MAFKIGDELINMIGDFTNMNRSPDFKSKTSENVQKAARIRIGRRHSLNLAVGVADEMPPFSTGNVATIRRQSIDKILHPSSAQPVNQRALSDSAHMREDIEQIETKHGKSGKLELFKDKNDKIEESELELLLEVTDSPSSTNSNASESQITRKEVSTNNGDNDNISVSSKKVPSTKIMQLHTKIINNMGHRGSIVLIDDDDGKP
uniref:Uncharacterized protein n=1 Tax=Elaeophora elaphi TaxID=1147741 RepID=A0A0R3RRQ9_9BILA